MSRKKWWSAPGVREFLSMARRYSVPTREEEAELLARAKAGDKNAADEMVIRNLRLVALVASKYGYIYTVKNPADLLADGVFALIKAVEHFDPSRGARFSVLASYWLRAKMTRFRHNERLTVGGGSIKGGKKNGSSPSEIHKNCPEILVNTSLKSYGKGADADEEHGNIWDEIPDPAPLASERAEDAQRLFELRRAVNVIAKTPMEVAIAGRRLLADEPETLAEIAVDFHVSRERIRQVESRMLKRVREVLDCRMPGEVAKG